MTLPKHLDGNKVIRFTLTNHTLGNYYERQFKTDTEVNRWISEVEVPAERDCPFPTGEGLCSCHITIKVEDIIQ